MEWISVNDRLPESGKSVLGYMNNGYIKMVFHHLNGSFSDMFDTTLKGEVYFWMYLPKSPFYHN